MCVYIIYTWKIFIGKKNVIAFIKLYFNFDKNTTAIFFHFEMVQSLKKNQIF